LASLCSPIPGWESFARNQQTPNGVCSAFVLCMVGTPIIIVGIGFALLAHPCLVILCKKSATTYRCLHLIFVSYLLVSELPAVIKRKSGATFVVPDFLRRERDYGPIFAVFLPFFICASNGK
jgi:predicted membrane metal-binding protein